MERYSAVGNVIEKIVQDHGINALLDTRFAIAVFTDLAPTMRKEKELLRAFLECDGAQKLIAAVNGPTDEQRRHMESLVKRMQEDHWLTLDAAQYICSEFYRGITGREWKFGPVKPTPGVSTTDLDVYRSVTIKSTDRRAKMSVSVDVDGNKVNVPIPDRVVNGQTVCFPEKGKLDPASGKAGDLYVTIHVNAGVPAKLIIGILSVLVIVLIAMLLWKDSGSEDPSINQPVAENTTGSRQTEHVHIWKDATCATPKTCDTCGATEGEMIEHTWSDATCTLPVRCEFCGVTTGEPLGHIWLPATFTTAQTCTVCDTTEGNPIDYHSISVESEVLSIRETYNAIVSNKSAGYYRKENLRKGVDAYYDAEGNLACVIVYRGTDGIGEYSKTYSRSYYFADGELFFAFYEGSDSHRLYFYEELLMRWRYTGNGAKAVNHDFDFSEEYFLWEEFALNEIKTFY